ncbi:hypothetical protein PAXRUDRAFT_40034, partial [Paxillus rubicundulus Ve08.2h10]
QFLFEQNLPGDPCKLSEVPLYECLLYDSRIAVFNFAPSRFYAPSNLSRIASMHTEH